jgi:hypothetical protein
LSFVGARDTCARPLHVNKSFGMRSYKTPKNSHNFGANKPFRIRTCRRREHKPFRMRSYKKPGGEGGPLTKICSSVSP